MNIKLLSQIFHGAWAIEKQYAAGATPFIGSLVKGENVMLEEKSEYPYNVVITGTSEEKSGTVRVIPVKGALMKDDQFCGSVGMATLGNRVKQADDNPDIDAILLDMDTPGGTVDGTEVFADIIKNTTKPVVAFINGLTASAGMWIASAADKRIASTEHDKVGSIGVMLSIMDIQPALEKQGVKFHEIYSELSSDKNADYSEIRKGNYDNYIKSVLNPLAEKFQAVIKENIPNVKDNQLTGKIYFAKDVKGTLIDDIASFDDAVSEALKIAKSNTYLNNQTMTENNNQNLDLTTEKGLTAFIKKVFNMKTAEEKAAEKLAEEKAREAVNSAKEEYDTLKAENENLKKEIDDLKKEINTLKETPGAQTATVVKETDGKSDADPAKIEIPEGVSVEEQFAAFKKALDEAKK